MTQCCGVINENNASNRHTVLTYAKLIPCKAEQNVLEDKLADSLKVAFYIHALQLNWVLNLIGTLFTFFDMQMYSIYLQFITFLKKLFVYYKTKISTSLSGNIAKCSTMRHMILLKYRWYMLCCEFQDC